MATLVQSPLSRASNLRLLSSLLQPKAAAGRIKSSRAVSSVSSIIHQPLQHQLQPYNNNTTTTSSSSSPSSHRQPDASSLASSVSPTETLHFSRLASTWWDPHGPSRLLHLMNPHRHTFIASCLASSNLPLPNTNPNPKTYKYLDIGCGGGIFAESAARLCHTTTVTAIDPTASVLAVAQSHARTDPTLTPPKLTYLRTSIEDLPLPRTEAERTDILTLFEVLEHVDTPATFLRSCIRHLRRGGWLIGSTIARSPLSFLVTKVLAEAPLVGVVPRGTHDWRKYINPGELGGWFAEQARLRRGPEEEEEEEEERWGKMRTQGIVYVPALGWKMVNGTEGLGNYFFGVQKL